MSLVLIFADFYVFVSYDPTMSFLDIFKAFYLNNIKDISAWSLSATCKCLGGL